MESLEFYFQQFSLICTESREPFTSIDCKVIEVSSIRLEDNYKFTDTIELELEFTCHLPNNFLLDEIITTYSAGEGQSIEFIATKIHSRNGSNSVICIADVSRFNLEKIHSWYLYSS